MKPKLGILMEGGEEEFLRTVIAAMVKFEHPHYVEVGVAYGETLYGVWMAVKGIPNARVTGIELPEWGAWDCIERLFKDEPEFGYSFECMATINKGQSTNILSSLFWVIPISVAFIDACHGKPCVMADFIAVEKHCEVGSVVIFHDADPKDQGGSFQVHCQEPINVRAALIELGLLDNKRPGWEFRRMLPTANPSAVFEKVA